MTTYGPNRGDGPDELARAEAAWVLRDTVHRRMPADAWQSATTEASTVTTLLERLAVALDSRSTLAFGAALRVPGGAASLSDDVPPGRPARLARSPVTAGTGPGRRRRRGRGGAGGAT
ncbi:hypothetical protein [Candidatus Frankia nodulisporulans]|uniref:hypothetical protein n=1 Tax=Candidatus Frankia nodulisporulans TaxID=2060052 RepID=UPI0013D58DBA|nr:hypothetical protein [Candidatus Frankia nodulisporulans]